MLHCYFRTPFLPLKMKHSMYLTDVHPIILHLQILLHLTGTDNRKSMKSYICPLCKILFFFYQTQNFLKPVLFLCILTFMHQCLLCLIMDYIRSTVVYSILSCCFLQYVCLDWKRLQAVEGSFWWFHRMYKGRKKGPMPKHNLMKY